MRREQRCYSAGLVPSNDLHALAMVHWQVRDPGDALLDVANHRILACRSPDKTISGTVFDVICSIMTV